MEEEKKKTTFLFVFSTYLPVFLLKLDWESSLDAELNYASNEYPLGILLTDPATPKTRNTWKNGMMTSGYSLDVEFNSASNELSRSKFE